MGPGSGSSVSVYVASFNTAEATELCIRSARRYAGRTFSLHVGDCGSTDGSLAVLRRFETRGWLTIEVAASGRFHADWLDHWLAECTDKYAVFVDSDIEFLRPNWLRDIIDEAERIDAALVAAEMLPEVASFAAPRSGLDADRAELLDRWFRGHETVRLAARPAPWLLLLHVEKIRAIGASFAFRLDTGTGSDIPIAMDVGGHLFREVQASGIAWALMPDSFNGAYHHYGGLSWVPLRGRRGLKKVRDLLTVKRRLWTARRRDRAS